MFGRYFWLTLLLFMLTVVFVNPFWNTAVDDDWAYELTVKHFLDTGHYKLHPWATANIPFQMYWGALFAKVAGLSHASLRISTLVLWLAGLIAFYGLGLEVGFAPEEAGLLMLILFSSPMLVRMSFSFMTDVPYLSCLIITLYLWARALRTRHLGLMFLGSLAAAAAILTRQFGAALVGGLVLVWLTQRERARNAALFGIGLLLPIIALGWQFRRMSMAPTWSLKWHLLGQAEYFSHPSLLLVSVLWRPVIALEYLAFFTPALLLLPLAGLVNRHRGGAGPGQLRWGILALLVWVGVRVTTASVISRPSQMARQLMPYVSSRFEVLSHAPVPVRALMTALTTLGGVLLAWTFAERYLPSGKWKDLRSFERLVDFVTLCAMGEVLTLGNVMDDYIMPLLPYSVLVVGCLWRGSLERLKRPLVIGCAGVLALSVIYTRSYLAWREALWRGAEALRMRGVESCEISAGFEWTGYHCFEAFLAEHRNDPPDVPTFLNWLKPQRERSYEYVVTATPSMVDLSGYEPYMQMTWSPLPGWQRRLYILRRVDHRPPG